MNHFGIGLVGCGDICEIYIKNLQQCSFVQIKSCIDSGSGRGREIAKRYQFDYDSSLNALISRKDIDLIVNLTPPDQHASITLQALNADKHVYSEKPLASSLEQGNEILTLAKKKNLMVGCAPDTVLGAGIQTCRKLVETGWIGNPVGATAMIIGGGHESWHPNPFFYYQPGGGPLFDMGPYYLSALIHLLGPIETVAGFSSRFQTQRVASTGNKKGKTIPIDVDTHTTSLLVFKNRACATLTTSFDTPGKTCCPSIELYGTQGTLIIPDPNQFAGQIRYRGLHSSKFVEIPLMFPYHNNSRGLGIIDMVTALKSGKPCRANASLAYHVLECCNAILESGQTRSFIQLKSTCSPPRMMNEREMEFSPQFMSNQVPDE